VNDVFVLWVYVGAVIIFGGYAAYLFRLSRQVPEDQQ
jgi:hypothetical protein